MGNDKTKDLRQRRAELSESMAGLSRERDQTYRRNSDARALERTGVTQHEPEELARLAEGQSGADEAFRGAQRQLRQLDAEIDDASGGSGVGARMSRVVGRFRSSDR